MTTTTTLTFQPEHPPLTLESGGSVRVSGTRVSVDSIVEAHNRRETPEQIAESFPSVSLAQVYAVIAFYLGHRQEVDAYLRRREAEAQELRREVEGRQSAAPTRAELLARWEKKYGTPFPHHSDDVDP